MQIKKVDWINKPEMVKVRSHSLTFKSDRKCVVLYTLEEEGSLKLIKHSNSVSFLMLHTKEDRIIISNDEIDIKLLGSKAIIEKAVNDELLIEKKGEEIIFKDSENTILKLSNSAFFHSASFGFLISPSNDEIILEFY